MNFFMQVHANYNSVGAVVTIRVLIITILESRTPFGV